MGVVAVACVAVMNGQALGPMGRLHHHKSERTSAHSRHTAVMDFVDAEALPDTPDLTFSNARLGLAGLLTFPKFTADAPDDGPNAPALANIGFGRPVSGVGAIASPQATPSPPQDKPPQDPPPPDPPSRLASPSGAQWLDAGLTPDNPVPPVPPDPPVPPVIVVTPVVVITPPVSPPPELPRPVLPVTRLAAAPPPAPIPEPATWTMMVLGFSAVAAALRRRRRGTERGPAL
nr:hypothetical protein [Phenylobacterium sp.]